MVQRGGADAGGHGAAGCTHVVVFGLVYVSSHFLCSSGGFRWGAFLADLVQWCLFFN